MNTPVNPKFVDSWISFCKATDGTPEHKSHFWAFERWFEMQDDVELVWFFILAVLAKDQSNRVFELLSAGPLENLLADHGEEIIDRVEQEAQSNPHFARLLGGVWQSDTPPHVWRRC